MKNKKTVGIVIAKMRKNMEITQEEFGKLFNRTRCNVSRWERGTRFPTIQKYKEIQDVYNAFMEKKLEV